MVQVLFASRPVANGYEPGMTTNGKGQVSSLYNTNTGTYVVQPVFSSPFCMGHTHLADGTIITAGGDIPTNGAFNSGPLVEGRNVIRTYRPSTGWRDIPSRLRGMHWYAFKFLVARCCISFVTQYCLFDVKNLSRFWSCKKRPSFRGKENGLVIDSLVQDPCIIVSKLKSKTTF